METKTKAGANLRTFIRELPGIHEEFRLGAINDIYRAEEQAYWKGHEKGRLAAKLQAIEEIQKLRPPDRFVAMDGSWEQGFSEVAVMRVLNPGKP